VELYLRDSLPHGLGRRITQIYQYHAVDAGIENELAMHGKKTLRHSAQETRCRSFFLVLLISTTDQVLSEQINIHAFCH